MHRDVRRDEVGGWGDDGRGGCWNLSKNFPRSLFFGGHWWLRKRWTKLGVESVPNGALGFYFPSWSPMPRRKVLCRKVIDRLMPEASQDDTKSTIWKRIQPLQPATRKFCRDVQFQKHWFWFFRGRPWVQYMHPFQRFALIWQWPLELSKTPPSHLSLEPAISQQHKTHQSHSMNMASIAYHSKESALVTIFIALNLLRV